MKNLICTVSYFLFFLIGGVLIFPASAQNLQYRDPDNPDRGAWQITTDPVTKNTIIRFFDGSKNQLYEETIAGKYIKLTNRNIARINKAFDQIMLRSTVAAQVKADPLDSPTFRKLSERQNKKQNQISTYQASTNFNPNSKLKAHAYQIEKSTMFHLIIKNPEQQRLIIDLSDEQGQSLYHESFSILNYSRRFDLTGMSHGQYKLLVTTTNRKQKYTRIIKLKPPLPLFPENQSDSLRQVNQELANHSNQLFLPLVK